EAGRGGAGEERAASPEVPAADLFALGRRQDTHQLPILRDPAPRKVDLLLAEQLRGVLVAQWLSRVLLGDGLSGLLPSPLCAPPGALSTAEARGEEVLELERPLRGVHVLAGRGAADRRLVHPDVVRDVLQHERAEKRDAFLEELALELHDARRDHVERALTLVDRLDDPGGGPHLLLDAPARLLRAVLT